MAQTKLDIFFWDFTRKDVENLCSVDLSFAEKTQENEMMTFSQDEFDFVEYLVDDKTRRHKALDSSRQAECNAAKTIKKFAKLGKTQIVLTNYAAFVSSLLRVIVCDRSVNVDDIVLHYKGNGFDTYYVKRDKIGDDYRKYRAYLVDKNGKEVPHCDNVVSCVWNEPDF